MIGSVSKLISSGKCTQRLLSTYSNPLLTAYDVRKFADPITDLEELKNPKDDEKNYLYLKAMKSDETPVFYRNKIVDKFIRVCMMSGQKVKKSSWIWT
uniref:39S ribosomal protein L50, mitochondrial n=1 Tax=Syphacia muris TaxID=451379 RepID=A0A0N5A891_9BILA